MLNEALGSKQHGCCYTARVFQMQTESQKDSDKKKNKTKLQIIPKQNTKQLDFPREGELLPEGPSADIFLQVSAILRKP